MYIAAKDLAAPIRKAIRAATKDANDPLYGLTVSVTSPQASLCSEVAITVKNMDRAELYRPEGDRQHYGWASERARDISDRLHELAAPAIEWADGKMHFCFITFDGLSAPAPRREWELTTR